MKILKKALVILSTVSILLHFFSCLATISVFATSSFDTSEFDTMDLSSYRKTYISNDNTDNEAYYSTSEADTLLFDPVTSLSLCSSAQNSLNPPIYDESKKVPVITLSDTTDLSIYLNTKDLEKGSDLGNNYKLSSDSFGNTQSGDKTPKIFASGNSKVFTGKIETGALVVQKSYDGITYTQTQLQKFNDGYYSTNYLDNFGGKNIEIFTPDGEDIKKGVYISVNFYFEASKYIRTDTYYEWWQYATLGLGMLAGPQGKTDVYEYKNIRESYTFFVIEDSVETVTFNNLTTADTSEIVEIIKPSGEITEEYKIQEEQYNEYLRSVINRVSETMYDGNMTTTGFRINVTANPYLSIQLQRNGILYPLPELKTLSDEGDQKIYEITQDGRYDITISSYSKQKTLTLYVDSLSPDEAYIRYFGEKVLFNGQAYGDNFLDYSPNNEYGNVRVFDSYSEVPVFLGPLTLNLKEQTDTNALPLYGVVTNKSTGKVLFVDTNQIKLSDYGEYEVLFSTNADFYERVILGNSNIEMAGDVRVYKFNFKVVGKDGDTTVNEQLLSTGVFKDLSVASPSDYAPLFYGVKRSSANKGEVIVAFADRESALKYAKDVVWSEIETHTDSNGNTYWLIPNTENPFGAKVESYSGWKNAQVVRELAEKMVEERHFDLTKSASYLTLEKSVEDFDEEGVEVSNLLTNLQLASLEKSVVVWYSADQRSAATTTNTTIGKNNVITFVGKKNYALLAKGENDSYSEIVTGERDYRFIKDALGIDSHTLTAKDAMGNTFALNYEEGLVAQLKANNCNSGLVLITETNIYNNVTAQYHVYYIADAYQPATLTFSTDGQSIQVSQGNVPQAQTFNKLRIENISNYVDPYCYIRVTNKNSNTPTTYYSITEAIGFEFAESGDYAIAIIDRFGNCVSYEFSIN